MLNGHELKAQDFLRSHNAKIDFEFLGHDYYFDDDKVMRDIWRFEISRKMSDGKRRSYSGKFGQSIAGTGEQPTEYDVLACLEKYDVGSIDDFISTFGFTINSWRDCKKIEKTYKAVKREYAGVCRLFGDCLEELQEIY